MDDLSPLPNLGVGNHISIFRGFVFSLLAGFLLIPRPTGAYAILPGLLYTLGALPDFLDGYFARVTNQVTRLGENLDMIIDSVGVLVAAALAALHGQVPYWYVLIGLARYLFLAGMWIRHKLGLPNHEMPYSIRRRGLAGLQMGFLFVILWPGFRPPASFIAAYCFGIPFLISFLWDWFIVSGVISGHAWPRSARLSRFLVRWFPIPLRMGALMLGIMTLPQAPAALIIIPLSLLSLGFLGRVAAAIALISLGLQAQTMPLTLARSLLIPVYVALLTLGTGKFSLWPLEDRWVYHRAGERK